MAQTTLATIQQKIRRLTRSLDETLLSTSDLNQYINTFVLYDFPEHLRLFNLQSTFTFYTQAYIDTYSTNSTNPLDPLYNFDNIYLTVNPPIYIAGYEALFMESRKQFYGIYPLLNSIASIGISGDGSTTNFTGVINTNQSINYPFVTNNTQGVILLRNNVLFNSIDTNNNTLTLIDYPYNVTTGYMGVPGTPATPTSNTGTINYLTGQFNITFPVAPGVGQPINSQTLPLQPSLPQTMLFYDGQFVLRPVPDQSYAVQMEVFVRPTELLSEGQSPQLEEWFQLISYGAAKKIFEDRMDLESVALILPEFQKQMTLCQRRTIVQQTTQRTATIYTQDNGAAGAYGPGWFSGGGQS